jgi:dTDP-4-amino-4,6-dideoxygalactose transaminase
MEVRTTEVSRAFLGTGGSGEEFVEALRPFGISPYASLVSSARVGLFHLFRMSRRSVAILPAYTCRAVVEAARLAGLKTEFVDIDLDTFTMIPDQVAGLASPDAVIVATHQFGIPCDVQRLSQISEESGAMLVEDCAGAFGSTVDGVAVGRFSRAAVFSFEATKVLTLGRGGLVTFGDSAAHEEYLEFLGQEAHSDASHGLVIRVLLDPLVTSLAVFQLTHRLVTLKSGLTSDDGKLDLSWEPRGNPSLSPWQIRLGLRMVERLGSILERRRELTQLYIRELRDLAGIELPSFPAMSDPVLIRFPVRVTTLPKVELYRRCVPRGLDFAFSFSYACDPDVNRFPNSHLAASQVLDLPIYSKISNDLALDACEILRAALVQS